MHLRGIGRLAHQVEFVVERYLANSATTSRGFRRRPSDQTFSSSAAAESSSARSCAITASMSGRRILTATSWPPSSDRNWRNAPAPPRRWPPVFRQIRQILRSPVGHGGLNLGRTIPTERRYAILQFRQLVGDIEWQQVGAWTTLGPNLTKIGPNGQAPGAGVRHAVLRDDDQSAADVTTPRAVRSAHVRESGRRCRNGERRSEFGESKKTHRVNQKGKDASVS